MKRIVLAAAAVIVLAAAAGGFVLAARWGLLTPGDAALEARYALPNSRFVQIEGQRIHYVDEGAGPPILLVHGSFGSLLMWNDWAAALKGRHRVIRFDRPPMGLSGKAPDGRYDAEREMRIIEGLRLKLGLEPFVLVATSSGGESAAAYAAEHPGQIRGVVLSNIAPGPFKPDTTHLSPQLKLLLAIDPWFKGWVPRAFWKEVIKANFNDPRRVSTVLAAQWTDLNNRAQRMPSRPPAPGHVSFARTPADLARISAPALVLWSDHDHELPLETAGRTTLRLLGSADKTLLVVPDCGHMQPLECGPQSVALAEPFLDRLAGSH